MYDSLYNSSQVWGFFSFLPMWFMVAGVATIGLGWEILRRRRRSPLSAKEWVKINGHYPSPSSALTIILIHAQNGLVILTSFHSNRLCSLQERSFTLRSIDALFDGSYLLSSPSKCFIIYDSLQNSCKSSQLGSHSSLTHNYICYSTCTPSAGQHLATTTAVATLLQG